MGRRRPAASCSPTARRRPRRVAGVLGPRRRLRAGLGTWPDGATGLELLDGAGTLRARVGQRAPDGPATVELYGADGRFKAAMAEEPGGGGIVDVWDTGGEPVRGER